MDETISYSGSIEGVLDPREHDNLIGHDEQKRLIQLAFDNDRFPQAWLLQGPEGIGKATFAWHFGRRLAEFGEIDIRELPREIMGKYKRGMQSEIFDITLPSDEKGGYKSQIPVESIRTLNEKLVMSDSGGHWRIVIIEPADALNTNAANALLKLLEEPPARVVFFLISAMPHKLLPTIHSRTQHLRFQELSIPQMQDIWSRVCEEPLAEEERFSLAEGSIRQALTMTNDMSKIYQTMVAMLQFPLTRDQIINNTKAVTIGSRQESIARAQILFQIFFGRLARIASNLTIGTPQETEAASKISHNLSDWANLSINAQKAFDDAMRLNLDAEITIFNQWLEIDKYLSSS